jgi:hypothetical protein
MKTFFLSLFLVTKVTLYLSQQPADLDPTFNNSLIGFGSSGAVQVTAFQDDGKIIVSGILYNYNGISCNNPLCI